MPDIAKVTFAEGEIEPLREAAKAAGLPLAPWLRKQALAAIGRPFDPLPRGFASLSPKKRATLSAKGGKRIRP